jgi:intraflagellar transport protein 81
VVTLSSFDRAAFRQGIVQGDKAVIHPIIEWLLRSIPDLKKRAYLARYLVKIDIPPDFIVDEQIAELFQQVRSCLIDLSHFQYSVS